jgi:hypothetical protein
MRSLLGARFHNRDTGIRKPMVAFNILWEESMKLPRRNFLHLFAGAAVLPAVSRVARAQAYPTKPVRLIVGYAAGGVNDCPCPYYGAMVVGAA